MMSMYNAVFGKSRSGPVLLAALGLNESDFYRFRDCYLDDKKRIAVYTRGGGGNRDCFCGESWNKDEPKTDTSLGEPHCATCAQVIQAKNRKHPQYLKDEDDDFDCTYATFYFRIPEDVDRTAADAKSAADLLLEKELQSAFRRGAREALDRLLQGAEWGALRAEYADPQTGEKGEA